MRPELTALLDQVSLIGQQLSPEAVVHLADGVGRLSDASEAGRLTAPTAPGRVLVERLVQLWQVVPDVAPLSLGLALLAASRTAEDVAGNQVVELVWTGPRTEAVPVRRNDQALLEVIASAEQELLLVSYAVYHVPTVVSALSEAVARGVDVRLVLEFQGSEEGDQTYDPLKALGQLPAGVRVYEWPFEVRPEFGTSGKRGYLHVKCAVADRDIAFVSSANLTAYAMEANMELGVLVRGGTVPQRIASQFDRLIAERILVGISQAH
jgi:phosphatidylserine/phosphatidylglycerophosphate/cardiolipin synthase-like enzyme